MGERGIKLHEKEFQVEETWHVALQGPIKTWRLFAQCISGASWHTPTLLITLSWNFSRELAARCP
jgi:hypothetical protein